MSWDRTHGIVHASRGLSWHVGTQTDPVEALGGIQADEEPENSALPTKSSTTNKMPRTSEDTREEPEGGGPKMSLGREARMHEAGLFVSEEDTTVYTVVEPEGIGMVLTPGRSGRTVPAVPKPEWEDRLKDAAQVGIAAARSWHCASQEFYQPKRWHGYVNRYWAVLQPAAGQGVYSSWRDAKPRLHRKYGDYAFGFASKSEGEACLAAFRAHDHRGGKWQ